MTKFKISCGGENEIDCDGLKLALRMMHKEAVANKGRSNDGYNVGTDITTSFDIKGLVPMIGKWAAKLFLTWISQRFLFQGLRVLLDLIG